MISRVTTYLMLGALSVAFLIQGITIRRYVLLVDSMQAAFAKCVGITK